MMLDRNSYNTGEHHINYSPVICKETALYKEHTALKCEYDVQRAHI